MRDNAAVTLRSEDNAMPAGETAEGLRTLLSSSDWRLKVLQEDGSGGTLFVNGTYSKGTLLRSLNVALSFSRDNAALSAVARAASNVRLNSDENSVNVSDVTLPKEDDSGTLVDGDSSRGAPPGTTEGRAIP